MSGPVTPGASREGPEDPRVHLDHRTPAPVLRKAAGPLILYHAMILSGAFLIVAWGGWGYWRLVGAVLVGAGIVVELSVLIWSASLTRSASIRTHQDRPTLPTSPPVGRRRVCVACGKVMSDDTPTCPRCGRPVVSLG